MSQWSSIWGSPWGSIWKSVWYTLSAVACNISTYWNGTEFVTVPFVDDGGNLVPATDGIKCDELGDTIIYDSPSLHNYIDGGSNYICAVYTLETITIQKATIECTSLDAVDKSSVVVVLNTNGKFLYQVRNALDGGLLVSVDGLIAFPLGTSNKYVHRIDIIYVSPNVYTFRFSVNGILDKEVPNVDCTKGLNLDFYSVDGTGAAPLIGKVFELCGSKFSSFNLNTRLLPDGENQLVRTNIDGHTITIGNLEQVYPYIENAGAYLASDTPCADNPLVINELTGIAVVNELTGNFIVNEVI